ncbi:uncharacterized protein [Palaemon carinicauda]|uniref:uncharacterized protein n=1 Tax=Palaemon carinicauda TaxID=392227 RepID=UPI0035B62462
MKGSLTSKRSLYTTENRSHNEPARFTTVFGRGLGGFRNRQQRLQKTRRVSSEEEEESVGQRHFCEKDKGHDPDLYSGYISSLSIRFEDEWVGYDGGLSVHLGCKDFPLGVV